MKSLVRKLETSVREYTLPLLHDCLEEFMQSLSSQCDRWNLITVLCACQPNDNYRE